MKLILIFILGFLWAGDLQLADLSFNNGKRLKIEVARTFSERYQGLMNRTSMPENNGMLFIFERPQKLSFWMKNTYIPLSVAYIDKNKVIKEIYDMKPQSMMEKDQNLKSYPSQCECVYALEVNQGWFKKNKVKVGDKISYSFVQSKK